MIYFKTDYEQSPNYSTIQNISIFAKVRSLNKLSFFLNPEKKSILFRDQYPQIVNISQTDEQKSLKALERKINQEEI